MLGKLRRDEGVSVLDDFVANRYFFGIGFKKASKGLNTHLFYEKTLDELKNMWQKQKQRNERHQPKIKTLQ